MSMISDQVDRLRTSAQTYRRLGNHTAEGMFLEAADTICELQTENAKLREQVDAAHMSRLLTENENEKLRELVADAWGYINHHADATWTHMKRKEVRGSICDRMRDLGVEVEE